MSCVRCASTVLFLTHNRSTNSLLRPSHLTHAMTSQAAGLKSKLNVVRVLHINDNCPRSTGAHISTNSLLRHVGLFPLDNNWGKLHMPQTCVYARCLLKSRRSPTACTTHVCNMFGLFPGLFRDKFNMPHTCLVQHVSGCPCLPHFTSTATHPHTHCMSGGCG